MSLILSWSVVLNNNNSCVIIKVKTLSLSYSTVISKPDFRLQGFYIREMSRVSECPGSGSLSIRQGRCKQWHSSTTSVRVRLWFGIGKRCHLSNLFFHIHIRILVVVCVLCGTFNDWKCKYEASRIIQVRWVPNDDHSRRLVTGIEKRRFLSRMASSTLSSDRRTNMQCLFNVP